MEISRWWSAAGTTGTRTNKGYRPGGVAEIPLSAVPAPLRGAFALNMIPVVLTRCARFTTG
jgi:hypothetical protein